MKRRVAVFTLVCVIVLSFASMAMAAAKFHIGIMTGTVSQGEDEVRGAELMLKKYGDVAKGGMIKKKPLAR